ncbi:hypothetical protein VTK73DRAFT_7317 [Phialemonium thermophilum]|uniref:Uncharacterized protein n=1 Tax=Phialemonium thermophilum TaxID=223376 RepID=A0ABR3XT14_9PEZI
MSEPPQLFGKPRPEPQTDVPVVSSLPQEEDCYALSEFPKRRRGRPPGRPNTTVRESDYESNPNVQLWNLAKADRPIPAVAINIRQALTEDCLVHDAQRAIFRLPSREIIYFVQGWITARHIATQRPSYVNGLLIHSRGEDSPLSCAQCVERRAKNALGPFLTCRILSGTFHNSCSNCKWFDNTSACSLYTGPKPNRKRKAKENGSSNSPASINGRLIESELSDPPDCEIAPQLLPHSVDKD